MTPIMRIYQGPPGTGKTYNAKLAAAQILDHKTTPGNFREKYDKLYNEDRIAFVTFHANYSYEDFVEGYRPVIEGGNMLYRVKPGPFLSLCNRLHGPPLPPPIDLTTVPLKIGDILNDYEVRDITTAGILLESTRDRKDAVIGATLLFADFWSLRRIQQKGLDPRQLSQSGQHTKERQEAAKQTGIKTTFFTNSSHYRAVYERFQEKGFEVPDVSSPAPPRPGAPEPEAVLIIDEINRADMSRVFGELLTLTEPDKRIGGSNRTLATLPYSHVRFGVPNGLHIIGTMNTTDKSLSVFDIALRRRFHFIELKPDPSLCASVPDVKLAQLLLRINQRLVRFKGTAFQLGHADFMQAALTATQANIFSKAPGPELRSLAYTLLTKTVPLLEEYFQGRRSLVQKAFGSAIYTSGSVGQDTDEEDDAYAEPHLILDVRLDPQSTDWDPTRFIQLVNQASGVE